MNIWTRKSIDLANQRDYLDQLFQVYPMASNLTRELSLETRNELENIFYAHDNEKLISILLKQELFPIKDSYVAYLKKDRTAIDRNPQTINRLAGALYSMGLEEMIKKMTLPKETNRQIGPLFKNWLRKKSLGVEVTDNISEFLYYEGNIVLDASDNMMGIYAKNHFGYTYNKGLDFIAKFNKKIIIGEAKFLSDMGGHQNAQLADALNIMHSSLNKSDFEVISIAILDGVVYIPGNNKMYKILENSLENEVILSSLLLRDYLYSL